MNNLTGAKKPLQAVVLFSVLSLLPALVSIFLLPVYLKELKPEEYGLLIILNLSGSLYSVVSIVQLNIAVTTNYFDYYEDQNKLKKFKSSLFSVSFGIATITLFLFILLGSFFLQPLIKSDLIDFMPLGLMVLITQYLAQLKSVYFVFVRNEYRLTEYAIYSVSLLFLNTIFQYYFIVIVKSGVFGSVSGALISHIIVTGALLILQRKLFDINPDLSMVKKSLRFSLPFIPIILMYWIFRTGDRFLLERLTDLATVGRYAVLIGLLLLAESVFESLGNAFRPLIFRSFNALDSQKLYSIKQFIMLYVKFGLFTLSGVILIGSNLNLITQNQKYLSIIPLFTLGVVVLISKLILRVPYLQLMYSKKTKLIAWITFVSMMILVLCLILLIPNYGIVGALYSIGISNVTNFLMFYYFAQRKFPLPSAFIWNAFQIILGFMCIVGLSYLGYRIQWYSIGIYGLIQFILVFLYLMAYAVKHSFSIKNLTTLFST